MMDDQDCIGKSRGRGRGREEGWKDNSHTMTYHDKKKIYKVQYSWHSNVR